MIELNVTEVAIPDSIVFNYDEIKMQLAETMQKYENVVYTADNMKQAKADKANLNKLKKALNDERIRREREYMKPFTDFKAKINELISLIDKPTALIDKQVKEYEETKKQEKRAEIEKIFAKYEFPEFVSLDGIFNKVWLNATCSMKSVEDDLKGLKCKINEEIDTISRLPEFSFEAMETYKMSLSLTAAITEGKRLADIQRRKEEAEKARAAAEEAARAEAERKAAEEAAKASEQPEQIPMPEPAKQQAAPSTQWIRFMANLTLEQAKELRVFFESRNIEYKAI